MNTKEFRTRVKKPQNIWSFSTLWEKVKKEYIEVPLSFYLNSYNTLTPLLLFIFFHSIPILCPSPGPKRFLLCWCPLIILVFSAVCLRNCLHWLIQKWFTYCSSSQELSGWKYVYTRQIKRAVMLLQAHPENNSSIFLNYGKTWIISAPVLRKV